MTMQHVLIRTTTEEFEYDPEKVKGAFSVQWRQYADRRNAERERRGQPTLAEGQLFEDWIIEQFELHDGSIFGDDLFGQIDCDSGSITLHERNIEE